MLTIDDDADAGTDADGSDADGSDVDDVDDDDDDDDQGTDNAASLPHLQLAADGGDLDAIVHVIIVMIIIVVVCIIITSLVIIFNICPIECRWEPSSDHLKIALLGGNPVVL